MKLSFLLDSQNADKSYSKYKKIRTKQIKARAYINILLKHTLTHKNTNSYVHTCTYVHTLA